MRHIFFESTHGGYLKYLNKKYMPKYVKKYLLNNKLKKLSIFPETISIETTNICNAKFCFAHNRLVPDQLVIWILICIKKLLRKSKQKKVM